MAAPLFRSPEDSLYQRLLAQLDQSHRTASGKFLLRYALRNRPGQRGRGVNGVEHPRLLQIYEQALDRTYARFVADGWQEPLPDPRHGVIPVNIGHPDSAPFDPHTVTPGKYSTIWLRSLITEP